MERSANLAESGLLANVTFFCGCENMEQVPGDRNAQMKTKPHKSLEKAKPRPMQQH